MCGVVRVIYCHHQFDFQSGHFQLENSYLHYHNDGKSKRVAAGARCVLVFRFDDTTLRSVLCGYVSVPSLERLRGFHHFFFSSAVLFPKFFLRVYNDTPEFSRSTYGFLRGDFGCPSCERCKGEPDCVATDFPVIDYTFVYFGNEFCGVDVCPIDNHHRGDSFYSRFASKNICSAPMDWGGVGCRICRPSCVARLTVASLSWARHIFRRSCLCCRGAGIFLACQLRVENVADASTKDFGRIIFRRSTVRFLLSFSTKTVRISCAPAQFFRCRFV